MATVRDFQELEIWQMARAFAKRIFELTEKEPFSKDFGLRDQINKSSGSIMDNIAEGFERDGRKEFINFLSYAKGSTGECRSQLVRAIDRKYIDENTFNELSMEAKLIGKKIASFMNYLKTTEYKGIKFSEPETLYGN